MKLEHVEDLLQEMLPFLQKAMPDYEVYYNDGWLD